MIDQVLLYFPAHTHALTLVSDPDEVLAEETILAALAERGFSLIEEADPVQLRLRVMAHVPFRVDRALVVVTAGPVGNLPYDLWRQGHRLTLALHTFFPRLTYPLVQALTPEQRRRLSETPAPGRTLGKERSLDFIFRQVFELDVEAASRPEGLVAWLNELHGSGRDPLPGLYVGELLSRLGGLELYRGWPLADLITDGDAFAGFVSSQWRRYLQQTAGQPLGEAAVSYVLPFESNQGLQDTLPRLLRGGAVRPVSLSDVESVPIWARGGVLTLGEDERERRVAELLESLAEVGEELSEARWPEWRTIARLWAELTATIHAPGKTREPEAQRSYQKWQADLDEAFLNYLRRAYQPLGARKLPVPGHLFHVPEFMAYEWRNENWQRLALLILDGMALSDWMVIGSAWRARHPEWRLEQHLLLAQAPTVTAISRQALVGGKRPADFADTLTHNRSERKRWKEFWTRYDVSRLASAYETLHLEYDASPPDALTSARVQALCLVNTTLDDIVHGARQGTAGVQGSLRLWLDHEGKQLEAVIEGLLDRGYTVYLASDHGHTEAIGMGQGVDGLAETRSKRARVYGDAALANSVREKYPDTIEWSNDSLLPQGYFVLIAGSRDGQRLAFAPKNERVVSHGGLTLDEMVVPLVRIRRR